MAKFSKGHYLILANALLRARCELLAIGGEAAVTGVNVASQRIADSLAVDNRKFDMNHFMAVIRGERSMNSKPPSKHLSQD